MTTSEDSPSERAPQRRCNSWVVLPKSEVNLPFLDHPILAVRNRFTITVNTTHMHTQRSSLTLPHSLCRNPSPSPISSSIHSHSSQRQRIKDYLTWLRNVSFYYHTYHTGPVIFFLSCGPSPTSGSYSFCHFPPWLRRKETTEARCLLQLLPSRHGLPSSLPRWSCSFLHFSGLQKSPRSKANAFSPTVITEATEWWPCWSSQCATEILGSRFFEISYTGRRQAGVSLCPYLGGLDASLSEPSFPTATMFHLQGVNISDTNYHKAKGKYS